MPELVEVCITGQYLNDKIRNKTIKKIKHSTLNVTN